MCSKGVSTVFPTPHCDEVAGVRPPITGVNHFEGFQPLKSSTFAITFPRTRPNGKGP